MDVRFLNTFIEVAKTKHFGKAAENLYLTQSAVSARIRQLEEYFNTPLFIRERHSTRLTSTGERLLPYAESMVSTLQDAKKALNEVEVQHLAIGFTTNLWSVLASDVLSSTFSHYPDLSLKSEVLSSEQLSRQLHERTTDIGLSIGSLKSDDLITYKVGEFAMGLFTSQTDVKNEEICPYIQINWGHQLNAQLIANEPQCRHASLQTNSMDAALKAIEIKKNATLLLPLIVATPLVEAGKLYGVKASNEFAISVYVSCIKSTQQTSLMDYFEFYSNPAHYGNLFKQT